MKDLQRELRRGLVVALGLTVLGVAAAVPWSGALSPRLRATPNSSWQSPNAAGLEFTLRDAGWIGADIAKIDGTAAGLGTPDVVIHADVLRRSPDDRPSLQLPIHLKPGAAVHVQLSYHRLDCGQIDPNPDHRLPIRANGPLHRPLSVGVHLGGFSKPSPSSGMRFFRGRDPLSINWSAGITWTACHPER